MNEMLWSTETNYIFHWFGFQKDFLLKKTMCGLPNVYKKPTIAELFITFPVTVKMVKTTIFLVLLSLLYQAHAAPQDAAAAEPAADAAAEPAADAAAPVAKLFKKAQEMLDKTDSVVVAKLTALADCPTKIGTAAELLMQISAALISCKTAPDADAPAPEAPVEVEGFPVDKALMADAEGTEVLTVLANQNLQEI